jgi:hypothetical protein
VKTLLAMTMIVAAVALAWGRSEYERATYFAALANQWEESYNCVVGQDGKVLNPRPTQTCFVDLPPGE